MSSSSLSSPSPSPAEFSYFDATPFSAIDRRFACYPINIRNNPHWLQHYHHYLALMRRAHDEYVRVAVANQSAVSVLGIPMDALRKLTRRMVPDAYIVYGSEFAELYQRITSRWVIAQSFNPGAASSSTGRRLLRSMMRPDLPLLPRYSSEIYEAWSLTNTLLTDRLSAIVLDSDWESVMILRIHSRRREYAAIENSMYAIYSAAALQASGTREMAPSVWVDSGSAPCYMSLHFSFAVILDNDKEFFLLAAIIDHTRDDLIYDDATQAMLDIANARRAAFCELAAAAVPLGPRFLPPIDALVDWTEAFLQFPVELIVFGTPIALHYLGIASQWVSLIKARKRPGVAEIALQTHVSRAAGGMLEMLVEPTIPTLKVQDETLQEVWMTGNLSYNSAFHLAGSLADEQAEMNYVRSLGWAINEQALRFPVQYHPALQPLMMAMAQENPSD
ncbi:hypothetical protein GALMADRAFT_213928 [Galerina marginata CBS 339.88]|uniref:Uncharacterized protein n=1 Tax=Galerina marginata (strain CBS 339.88) TaxID=685588 RepID=A0A067SJX0_GALM3|nr:hypothetical protein GALMADRAFT_213928 [Galerina marginata CBS 339.88]